MESSQRYGGTPITPSLSFDLFYSGQTIPASGQIRGPRTRAVVLWQEIGHRGDQIENPRCNAGRGVWCRFHLQTLNAGPRPQDAVLLRCEGSTSCGAVQQMSARSDSDSRVIVIHLSTFPRC